MKICTRCVLPSTFPGISFNRDGVCNFCSSSREKADTDAEKKEYLQKFNALIGEIRGKSDYDCTLSFSGGKDSTYTLYLLTQVFKLNVLALTFDNGFLSPQAFTNIRAVTEKLGADSLIFKADFNHLKKIFVTGRDHALYSAKTLERASTICTSCIGLAKFIFLKTALEKKIPVMVWGWTPGQAPIRSSIMKINPAFFKQTQEAIRKPLEGIVGGAVNRYFLRDDQFAGDGEWPFNVSPLAFMDYNENAILEKIQEFGWVAPDEVDANSTNCLLNSYANRIHMNQHHFHPYAFEIAGMVRMGVMTREEGLKKMEEPECKKTVAYVKEKLQLKD